MTQRLSSRVGMPVHWQTLISCTAAVEDHKAEMICLQLLRMIFNLVLSMQMCVRVNTYSFGQD